MESVGTPAKLKSMKTISTMAESQDTFGIGYTT